MAYGNVYCGAAVCVRVRAYGQKECTFVFLPFVVSSWLSFDVNI